MDATGQIGEVNELSISLERLISRSRAALLLDVHPRTLCAWEHAGNKDLPVVKVGKLAKYRLIDVQNYIGRQVQAAGQSGVQA